jgi:GNAT superfamily N-acetyltransferase
LVFGVSDQVRADWMLISDSGAKPGRSDLFADIESMVDPSQSLKEGNAVFRGDKAELAKLEEKRRRFKSLRLVENLEDPKGPESRYWSVEMDGDQKSFRVLDAREFQRDASFQALPVTDWQPLSSRPWGDIAYRFAYDQERWRKALRKLQERVKRDGTVSEQTELESLGYQLVRNETDSGFSDLVWKYVWVDGSRPPANDSALVIAKIGYGIELSKMGVRPEARGHSAGTKLLQAVLDMSRALGAQELYLLSSRKCQAAVHLYEKFGFRHDLEVMARHGGNYSRCDVAMSYPLALKETVPGGTPGFSF